MKIGIITHYDVHNHGALLQLNALIRILSIWELRLKHYNMTKTMIF